MSVLVVTYTEDPVADAVIERLRDQKIAVERFDTDLFPWRTRLSFDSESPCTFLMSGKDLGQVVTDSVTTVWFRRESPPSLPQLESQASLDMAIQETQEVLKNLFACLDCQWVDPIPRIEVAERKIPQLQVARSLGLAIPKTLVTNDPAMVRRFFTDCDGQIIAKMLSVASAETDDGEVAVFTTQVSQDDLRELSGLRYSPMCFQEKIDKRYDLRITVVGKRVLPVAIDSQLFIESTIDWRRIPIPAQHCHQISLPRQVEGQILSIMDHYHLRYGAIDMILTPADEYVFLELNPCGDWSWLPTATQESVADAFSHLFAALERHS